MDGVNLRSRRIKRSSNYCELTTSEEEEDSDIRIDDEEVKQIKVVMRPKRKSTRKSSVPVVITTPTTPRPNAARKSTRQSAPNQTKLMKGGFRSIASYFGGKSPDVDSKDDRELKKRKRDEETKEFLTSGLPQAVIRAQKVVEKRKEEDDYLSKVEFYPKITSVCHKDDMIERLSESSLCSASFKQLVVNTEGEEDDLKVCETDKLSQMFYPGNKIKNNEIRQRLCCPSFEINLPRQTKGLAGGEDRTDTEDGIPWIEKHKVEHLEDLVVDKKPLTKLKKWLKQWKSDISDDGGTSRKLAEKKRRRRDSESDYESSDEEQSEFKSKSVILAGPPGCGKTAAVYVTAKYYGFHVVEVSFSSRRSGKEVMQRVEEAVLSHRLESTSNCLLLFKDIELVDGEEDEGFYAAVAKLITTAVRPIVMTISSLNIPLDPKIEKKEPLRIVFEPPKSSHLVKKILMPIIMEECLKRRLTSKEQLQDVKSILTSIVTHARSDIRNCINQTQYLFGSSSKSCANVGSELVHQNSIQPEGLVDLNFILPTRNCDPGGGGKEEESEEDDAMNVTLKGRKKKELKALDTLCESLSSLTDLDFVNGLRIVRKTNLNGEEDLVENEIKTLKSQYFDPNFCATISLDSVRKFKAPSLEMVQRLSLSSQEETNRMDKVMSVSEEMCEYFESGNAREDWEAASAVRTIVKLNAMDSVTRLAKRNGRMTYYFNRLDKCFVERICDSFGYSKYLKETKDSIRYATNNNFF